MKALIASSALFMVWCSSLACFAAAPKSAASIRRLDGTTISFSEAEAFARKTFADSHVTGAQIAVVDQGQLVWSDTVTPWEWEGYTPEYIERSRKLQ
jgi:CubicO group peptidase (beta-lactamase class C family)